MRYRVRNAGAKADIGAGGSVRTNGVGRLHLEGDGLARNCRIVSDLIPGRILSSMYVRVFTKICMLSVMLDLVLDFTLWR